MVNTRPKPYVFVLMPFDGEFDDIYQLGIKVACEDAGAYCERVDEQIFSESILQRIYNQISKADIIVADMTGRNANVFYEAGYAHALGKSVVLLTSNADDIPFDLKHYPHIVYGGSIVDLKQELNRRISWYIDNPNEQLNQSHSILEFYIQGSKMHESGNVLYFELPDPSGFKASISIPQLKFVLDIHNPSERVVSSNGIEIGFILPKDLGVSSDAESILIPGDRRLHMLRNIGDFLPGGWQSVEFAIPSRELLLHVGQQFPCTVRVFAATGYSDMEFTLGFQNDPTAK